MAMSQDSLNAIKIPETATAKTFGHYLTSLSACPSLRGGRRDTSSSDSDVLYSDDSLNRRSSQGSQRRPGLIFEREMPNSKIICGNPNRQLWMLPVTFKSKKCQQPCMLPVEREKGSPNLFDCLKAHRSKINPEIRVK